MNKVYLIGNMARDPETSTTTSGVKMCRFAVAVNRNYTNADGGRDVDFINCTAWRNNAERCGRFLHKGNKVAIVGSLQIRSYEANGEKRTGYDVVVDEVEFLTPRGTEGGSAPYEPIDNNSTSTSAEKVVELEPVEDSDLPF